MFSIVYEHCLDLNDPTKEVKHTIEGNIYFVQSLSQAQAMPWIVQPLKFGTICFFIISGYLLGKHLSILDSPWSYYRRRLKVVGIPYLIAAGLFYLINIHIYGVIRGRYDIAMWTPDYLLQTLQSTILFSSYWFVFVFLLALGTFLLFWRKSDQPLFSWLTFTISIFYGLNVYLNWIEQRHNLAMPAYLFYLWVGVYLSRRDDLVRYLQQVNNAWVTTAVLLSLCLAVAESTYLWSINSVSPFNTVRLSNQLYSVVIFIWLLRNDFSSKLTWFKPRTESFGIYLYHLYFVLLVGTISNRYTILIYHTEYTGLELFGITLIRFLLIYSTTLLFVKLVNMTRLRWLLGS